VLITAGRRDPICPAPLTQRLADWLEGQEAEVQLHWHPGGHEIASSEWGAVQAFLEVGRASARQPLPTRAGGGPKPALPLLPMTPAAGIVTPFHSCGSGA
jgi:hypothetical protein